MVMGREGADAHIYGTLYRAVVQAVLIFRSETWMMSPLIGKALGGFHHRVIHQLTGRYPRHQVDGSWVYPHLEAVTVEAGLEEVNMYVTRLQKTVSPFIAIIPIM